VSALGTGHVSAATGDLFTVSGDIYANSGDLTIGGNSLLNRMQYETYYGGSTFGSPIVLNNGLPYQHFTLPNGKYNFVLFCKGIAGSMSYPLELHTSYTNLQRNYSIKVDFQTADNAGNASLGFNNVVIGYADSAPTDSKKIGILVNSSLVYATPSVLKITVHLEYSPSP